MASKTRRFSASWPGDVVSGQLEPVARVDGTHPTLCRALSAPKGSGRRNRRSAVATVAYTTPVLPRCRAGRDTGRMTELKADAWMATALGDPTKVLERQTVEVRAPGPGRGAGQGVGVLREPQRHRHRARPVVGRAAAAAVHPGHGVDGRRGERRAGRGVPPRPAHRRHPGRARTAASPSTRSSMPPARC